MSLTFTPKLHNKQLLIFKELVKPKPASTVCLVAGRRFGKTSLLLNTALVKVLSFDPTRLKPNQKRPIVSIIAPTLAQCKELYWDDLVRIVSNWGDLVKALDKTTATIKFNYDLPDLVLKGAIEGRIRGPGYWFVGCDEFQLFPDNVWDEAIAPGLADTYGATSLVIGTPIGKHNLLYKFHLRAQNTPNWKYYHFNSIDNPKPAVQRFIAQAKDNYPERAYKQEFLASFEDFEGQIFDCFTESNIQDVSTNPDDYEYIYLGIDWGDVNPCIGVIGQTRTIPHKYVYLDCFYPQGTQTVLMDELKAKALEFAQKYNIQSTWPDTYQPGHEQFIYEFMQMPHPGLRNIDPDVAKLYVMPSCKVLNQLFRTNRFIINRQLTEVVDDFRSFHREKTKEGFFRDKPSDKCRKHSLDCARYVVCRVEEAIVRTYGDVNNLYFAA